MEIINICSKFEKLWWMLCFSEFFVKIIWMVYGLVLCCDVYFNIDVLFRKKRFLNFYGCIFEVYKCFIEDKVSYK